MKNKMYIEKWENIEIISVLSKIVKQNVNHYQEDFYFYDTEKLIKAQQETNITKRIFVWMCRENGTWLWEERDVYLAGSTAFNAISFYEEQTNENRKLYVIEIDYNEESNSPKGTLYLLDKAMFYDYIHAHCFFIYKIKYRRERDNYYYYESPSIFFKETIYLDTIAEFYGVPENEQAFNKFLKLERKNRRSCKR